MGISSLPAASEGVLCVLLVSTAFSIHIVKCIIRSIVHFFGIHLSSSSSSSEPVFVENRLVSFDVCLGNADRYIEEFRSRIPPIRFEAVCSCSWVEHDCSVCLTPFEPESEIYRLSCDHIFHKVCMEKWLNYWNVTCPLCRTYMLPEDDPASLW